MNRASNPLFLPMASAHSCETLGAPCRLAGNRDSAPLFESNLLGRRENLVLKQVIATDASTPWSEATNVSDAARVEKVALELSTISPSVVRNCIRLEEE